ncbi:hypothetical protein NEIPOLOT_00922 [Neisseria polysaccharea ATCC 43768]|nr:hypothetical protein NEIPOLOT_00922 [Neisseria polysaccharea ATCC 43768]
MNGKNAKNPLRNLEKYRHPAYFPFPVKIPNFRHFHANARLSQAAATVF